MANRHRNIPQKKKCTTNGKSIVGIQEEVVCAAETAPQIEAIFICSTLSNIALQKQHYGKREKKKMPH